MSSCLRYIHGIEHSLAASTISMRRAMSLVLKIRDPMRCQVPHRLGRLIVCCAGCFLVATAILKTLWPADAARLEAAYELPSWLTAVGVQVELATGLWLLSGWRSAAAIIAATGLFFVFAMFSLYRALAGYESCGCFGQLTVNPWWTFVLDAAVVACLIAVASNVSQSISALSRTRTGAFLASYVFMLAITLSPCLWPERSAAGKPGVSVNSGLVILEPEKWVGEPFPIGEFLSPRIDLEYGEWTVLIYHHGCPQCQAALSRYADLAESSAAIGNRRRVMLVESPPYASETPVATTAGVHVRLTDEQEWFVKTPVEIQVEDGQVATVSTALTH